MTVSLLLLLSFSQTTPVEDPRLWSAIPDSMQNSWTFSPTFEPGGQVAWFHHWDDPLNVDRPQRLYRIKRDESGWSEPEKFDIAPGQLIDWPHVSPGGDLLLLSIAKRISQRAFDFDLFQIAIGANGSLGEPEPVTGDDLNRAKTKQNALLGVFAQEFGGKLTNDGTLVFWSEREEATGGRDIFFAQEGAEGYLKPSEFEHNTRYRDSHPWISRSGDEMIFASNRPGTLGEDDLWYTRKTEKGKWSQPCRLPAPVNSPDAEGAAVIEPVTGNLLFVSDRPINGLRMFRVFEVARPEAWCA